MFLEAFWTVAPVTVENIYAAMGAVVASQGALVDVRASFVVSVEGQGLRTLTPETTCKVRTIVRTSVDLKITLINVLAISLIVLQLVAFRTLADVGSFKILADVRASVNALVTLVQISAGLLVFCIYLKAFRTSATGTIAIALAGVRTTVVSRARIVSR